MSVEISAFFRAADALPFTSMAGLLGSGGVVVVAPHPDDETLGCGGLLALAAEEGRKIEVVVVSDGAASHPRSQVWPQTRLRNLREEESRAAGAVLGIEPDAFHFLRLSDGAVPTQGDGADAAVAAIKSAIHRVDAETLLVTWGLDPHCDHQASFILARRARDELGQVVRVLTYPVWGHTLERAVLPTPPKGVRLDIHTVLARKRQGIRCHRSQLSDLIKDDPDGFRLDDTMIERFERPFEIFLEDDT